MGFFRDTRVRLDSLERRVRRIEGLAHRPSTVDSEVIDALRDGIVCACESGEVGTAALAIKALAEISATSGANVFGAVVFGSSGERRSEQHAGDGEYAADKGAE